ncbi:MAG TPA: hypothetical protein VNP04_27580 [Alphaproteobacteria bacterium]|nr:hypothetical protein [Alphaproteobacteria bacterium]
MLSWLLIALMCAQVWLDWLGLLSVTRGAVYFLLAGWLGGLAGVAAASATSRGVPIRGKLGIFLRHPDAPEILVLGGYLSWILSVVNSFSGTSPTRQVSVLLLVAACFIYTLVMLRILNLPNFRTPDKAIGVVAVIKTVPPQLAVRLLVFYTALPLCLGLAWAAWRMKAKHWQVPAELEAPAIAMLYVTLCSVYFGWAVVRSISMRETKRPAMRSAIFLSASIVLLSATTEYVLRGDWYFYLLSTLAFLGVFGGLVCLWPATANDTSSDMFVST